jgi:phosphoglycerate dehydrogenase-like enzyme
MKILVACDLPEFALEELRAMGLGVDHRPELTGEDLPEALHDVTVLIVAGVHVSAEAIQRGASLQMIVCWDADTSNVAIDEASKEGIFVAQCVDMSAVSIAELAIGMLIALDRGLTEHATDLRDARREGGPPTAVGLAGRTLGLLNLGEVERSIARRTRPLGAKVLAWAPDLTPDQAQIHGVHYCNHAVDLARRSNNLVIYAPTQELGDVRVNKGLLEAMQDRSSLVYIGHPDGFDEQALLDAVQQRGLKLALDIAPGRGHSAFRPKTDLLKQDGVIGTFRLANRTLQAWHASARQASEIVRRFLISGEVPECVNLLERSPATWLLVLRLRDTVGVMASVMEAIRMDGINAEEITSRVFQGAQAAWATVALDERPGTDALDTIRGLTGVLHLELRAVV